MGFWNGRRVVVTGHTGFKGSWLCEVLLGRGAQVTGIALEPDTAPSLFDQLALAARIDHRIVDIRDADALRDCLIAARPEIILHLAAQSLVRRSYREPISTFETNIMGTAHLLEAVRGLSAGCVVVVATTDKVYENREWEHLYREDDRLGGHDPYSASKAAAELVTASFRRAFFEGTGTRLATARAGNVIGGGDWAEDRIIPDLARAFASGKTLRVRNARSVRPWQHVLDPIAGYLRLAEVLAEPSRDIRAASFNFGPEPADQHSVGELVAEARRHWPGDWEDATDPAAPHEAGRLALSIERARSLLGWQPRWDFAHTVGETARWYRVVAEGGDPLATTRAQIAAFESGL